MILSKDIILKEIQDKRVKISPFDRSSVSAGAISLKLSDKIRVYKKPSRITLSENSDSSKYSELISIKKGYILKPGELVLAITKEKVCLADDICGWLQTRSRVARLGLMTHLTSNFIQPGVQNHQVLELFNAGPHELVLKPGQRLCKLVLERIEGHAVYKGRYKNQQTL